MYHAEFVPASSVRNDKKLQQSLLQIMNAKSKLMGAKTSVEESLKEFKGLIKESAGEFKNRLHTWVLVYEIDGPLVGFFVVGDFHGLPIWIIQSVNFPNAQQRLKFDDPHPFKTGFNALGGWMISERIHDIYWIQPDRPAIRKQWTSGNDIMRFCSNWYDDEKQTYKWNRYVEGVVPANETHPIEVIHKSVLANRTYEMPIVVRRFTLRNEYRLDWKGVSDWWPNEST